MVTETVKEMVKDRLIEMRRDLAERQGMVHDDITAILKRLNEYHNLDITIGKELAEIEAVLDECYPDWRNGN